MAIRSARLFSILVLLFLLAGAARAQDAPSLTPVIGLNAYAALADQQLDSINNGLRTIAATENAVSGDWNRIGPLLTLFAKGQPAAAAVWFVRPDGSYFTAESGRTGQNLKDRAYFPALMAGKEIAGDLVISRSTSKRSAIFAVPVLRGEHVIGALGVSVAMEKLAELIDRAIGFPPQVMFYALDARGQIALHRESSLLFEFATELGSPSLTDAVHDMLSRPEGMVRYEFQGAERQAVFKRSAVGGWVYALRW